VEDDENDVLFMQMALHESGVTNPLQVVRDGQQVIDYLKGAAKYANRQLYPLPCLVLMDIKLPYFSGLEVLKFIRQDPALRQVIVIILSSSAQESDIDEAFNLGTNAYIVKPHNIDDLVIATKAIKDFWLGFNMTPRIARVV